MIGRLRQQDTRPAYRGGGYGFPKITRAPGPGPGRRRIEGQYGAGRRRVYWEREGGLIPWIEGISQAREGEERGRGIPRSNEERRKRHEERFPGTPLPERGAGLSQDGTPVLSTVWKSLLAGLGLGVGFAIVNKVAKRFS